MSQITQLMHVLLFGIRFDLRLSAVDHVSPVRAILAPTLGGLVLGLSELWRVRTSGRIRCGPGGGECPARRAHEPKRDSILVSAQTLLSNGCGASVGLEAGYTQIGAGPGEPSGADSSSCAGSTCG